jgi:hypothetical protein
VRSGGGYILLDKFIEVEAPIEEAKLMKVHNVADKYKNTGMTKIQGSKNVYELENGGRGLGVALTGNSGKKVTGKK